MKRENNLQSRSSKGRIYFYRTYRHLHLNFWESLLYLLLFLAPAMALILFFYDELSGCLCYAAGWVLHAAGGPTAELGVSQYIPLLGPSYYLELPTVLPDYSSVLLNLGIALAVLWLISTGLRKGRPVSIYLSIMMLVHIMSCVFFLLGRDLFPYTTSDFSDLYMKQEIGIWIMFLLLMGLVMGVLGSGSVLRRIFTVFCVMAYSFLFGAVRYSLFLMILTRASALYMPVMFFALGPVFDFLYFVAIYAISTNSMIRKFDSVQRGEWVWA